MHTCIFCSHLLPRSTLCSKDAEDETQVIIAAAQALLGEESMEDTEDPEQIDKEVLVVVVLQLLPSIIRRSETSTFTSHFSF